MPMFTLAMRYTTRAPLGRMLPFLIGLAACSPAKLVDTQNPGTVVDPSLIQTAVGAAGLRTTAINAVMAAGASGAFDTVIGMSGMVTDELGDWFIAGASGDDRHLLDQTKSINANGYGYRAIQLARVQIRQARQALQAYANNTPSVPRAWQGEMYALEGYTVVWLAELYCSGIPLSSSSLTGAQVLSRGLTTQELFTVAVALFDSAATAGADSARFVNLARVGKARALIDLGQFAAADSAATGVPTNFVYTVPSAVSGGSYFSFAYFESLGYFRVHDHEGGNGLEWSTDPRTGVVTVPELTGTMLWPAKYNVDSATGTPQPTTNQSYQSFRLADGLEARLVQAEAALALGNGSWLTTLNTLRSTCVGSAACAPLPGLTSTSLPPLTDPGADTRLDTLMKERAMWLYLTGHREGDLRRMAHVYNRDPETLWPTGTMVDPAYPPNFPNPGPENGLQFGSDVVYGPDTHEQQLNPLYGGCYDVNP